MFLTYLGFWVKGAQFFQYMLSFCISSKSLKVRPENLTPKPITCMCRQKDRQTHTHTHLHRAREQWSDFTMSRCSVFWQLLEELQLRTQGQAAPGVLAHHLFKLGWQQESGLRQHPDWKWGPGTCAWRQMLTACYPCMIHFNVKTIWVPELSVRAWERHD